MELVCFPSKTLEKAIENPGTAMESPLKSHGKDKTKWKTLEKAMEKTRKKQKQKHGRSLRKPMETPERKPSLKAILNVLLDRFEAHMLSDVGGFIVSLVALQLAQRLASAAVKVMKDVSLQFLSC